MGLRSYYRNWLWQAFRHALGPADAAGVIVGAIMPPIAHFLPKEAPALNSLAWQIPLGALTATAIVRLILAPYWIHKATSKERDEACKALQQQVDAIQQRLDKALSQLRDLTTPRLQVSDGSVVSASTGAFWYRLRIINPTKTPIARCYVQLHHHMRSMNPNGSPSVPLGQEDPVVVLPHDGTEFPWQDWAGEGYERDIGPEGHNFVDIAVQGKNSIAAAFVRVPKPPREPDRFYYPIAGPVLYEGVVVVGSRNMDFQPSYARFVIHIDEQRLEVESVSPDSDYVVRRA